MMMLKCNEITLMKCSAENDDENSDSVSIHNSETSESKYILSEEHRYQKENNINTSLTFNFKWNLTIITAQLQHNYSTSFSSGRNQKSPGN